jgi:hypothetical protein
VDDFIQNVYTIYSDSTYPTIRLVLFNVLTKSIRVTVLEPNRDWGDDGLLGIELGEGAMDDFAKVYDQAQEIKNNPMLQGYLDNILLDAPKRFSLAKEILSQEQMWGKKLESSKSAEKVEPSL